MVCVGSYIAELLKPVSDLFLVRVPVLGAVVLLLGSFKAAGLAVSLLSVLYDTVVPGKPRLQAYKPHDSSRKANWAIVTGCTAGIGEQFAHQLAAAGFNIALVSRNSQKLEAVQTEIQAKHAVETAVFVLDAATAGQQQYGEFKNFVEGLKSVSVLINNAGISHDIPTPFLEVTEASLREIVQVNCVATLEVTRAAVPTIDAFIRANKGQRGLVLTMGSMAGLTPTPLLSVYSGSKMFLQGWSSALAEELRPKHIDVELVVSYLVTSKMSKVRRASAMCPTPVAFVQSTLRQIGLRGGAQERAHTLTPYWSHALMHWLIEQTFGVYSAIVAGINNKMHRDVRRRALKKLSKQQ